LIYFRNRPTGIRIVRILHTRDGRPLDVTKPRYGQIVDADRRGIDAVAEFESLAATRR